MRIVRDTREQRGYRFEGPAYADVTVEDGTLNVGDYSLAGLGDKVAVERKSLPDLVQCLGRERERFARELQRAVALDAFCVVVEASWQDLASGQYRSQLSPRAACQSVLSFMARLGISFIFAGNRSAAEYITAYFLRQYLEGARKRWATIVKAHGDGSGGEAA
ncbi:ERCC4 domain-containing protein [Desulfovibrio legallii]|jgi:DNA excision repair protein ERCC-4|uniref:ERCC4 domain-containing protein n=1 Tax=Desulfovibrio legallii TaxID=571438 RepID=A0A6H3FDC4_9BACT|nr:ERCC4 domain-containing protein [Desulfovibrio legallii]TBH80989.1 hypothetical protein EB812_02545 [Desulfovibrio legallii]